MRSRKKFPERNRFYMWFFYTAWSNINHPQCAGSCNNDANLQESDLILCIFFHGFEVVKTILLLFYYWYWGAFGKQMYASGWGRTLAFSIIWQKWDFGHGTSHLWPNTLAVVEPVSCAQHCPLRYPESGSSYGSPWSFYLGNLLCLHRFKQNPRWKIVKKDLQEFVLHSVVMKVQTQLS